jgi:hypothetical protein
MLRRSLVIGVALWLAARGVAAAAPPVCPPDGEVYRQAQRTLHDLTEHIHNLDTTHKLAEANHELVALLASPCFAVSAENPRLRPAKSVLSLQTFWNAGGARWVGSYLEQANPEIIVPPDLRTAVTLEDDADRTLAPILCSASDPGCGADTRGWLRRAAAFLRSTPRTERAPTRAIPDECQSAVKRADYPELRRCLERNRTIVPALPLGAFRAPKVGWLVVAGRRGHYDFCDELRLYDLATGAAVVAQSCGKLALGGGGQVDGRATDAGRVVQVHAGRLSVDNLREAALLFLLAPRVEKAQVADEIYARPAGLVPSLARETSLEASGHGSGTASSAQTQLRWSLTGADGAQLATGTLTWPDSTEPLASYLVTLLAVAEDSFVDQPLPAPPPSAIFQATEKWLGGVSAVDASRDSLEKAYQELLKAIRRM